VRHRNQIGGEKDCREKGSRALVEQKRTYWSAKKNTSNRVSEKKGADAVWPGGKKKRPFIGKKKTLKGPRRYSRRGKGESKTEGSIGEGKDQCLQTKTSNTAKKGVNVEGEREND